MENKIKISDYSDFDYKKLYWEDTDRQYENESEKNTIHYLLKYVTTKDSILDLDVGLEDSTIHISNSSIKKYWLIMHNTC